MQRYFSNKKIGNYLFLTDDDIYHIKTVMRMKDNDKIEVVYDNELYICCLENVKLDIQILIKEKIEKMSNLIPKITLTIPLLKENKLDFIFQKATEIGVSKFILTPMNRCVIRLNDSKKDNKLTRWKRIVKEASEQSKRLDIPDIEYFDNLKNLPKFDGLCLICSTTEIKKNLKRVLTKNRNCDRINLVIGPEGGFTEEEIKYLESINYKQVSLGSQILRSETVPLFLMSAIAYEYME